MDFSRRLQRRMLVSHGAVEIRREGLTEVLRDPLSLLRRATQSASSEQCFVRPEKYDISIVIRGLRSSPDPPFFGDTREARDECEPMPMVGT